MSIGNEFQADGAETAKALSVNRRRVRGIMKSPRDLERSRLSVHGLHIQFCQGTGFYSVARNFHANDFGILLQAFYPVFFFSYACHEVTK